METESGYVLPEPESEPLQPEAESPQPEAEPSQPEAEPSQSGTKKQSSSVAAGDPTPEPEAGLTEAMKPSTPTVSLH